MLPYYFSLLNYIPFERDSLVNLSKISMLHSVDHDNFVRKDNYPVEVLNHNFVNFLKDKNISIRKVVVWHWKCNNPNVAHIDSGPNGSGPTSAINWTIDSNNNSCVNFYEFPIDNLSVKYANQALPNWIVENVSSYIPIDVSTKSPITVWNDQGPCLINPNKIHMVVAPSLRITVSLQFQDDTSFLELVEKFIS